MQLGQTTLEMLGENIYLNNHSSRRGGIHFPYTIPEVNFRVNPLPIIKCGRNGKEGVEGPERKWIVK